MAVDEMIFSHDHKTFLAQAPKQLGGELAPTYTFEREEDAKIQVCLSSKRDFWQLQNCYISTLNRRDIGCLPSGLDMSR